MNMNMDRVAKPFVTFLAIFSCFAIWCAAPAQAQIVRLLPGGGVNVRAPFVRVHVDGAGNTHVRAPFVDIQAPGQGIPQPGFSNRIIPGQVVPGQVVPGQVIPGQVVPNGFDPNQPAPGERIGDGGGGTVEPSATEFYRGRMNRNAPRSAEPSRLEGTVSVLVREGRTSKLSNGRALPPIQQMNWRQLRSALRDAATSLDQVLVKTPTGNSLKRKLRTGTIRDLLAEDLSTMPDQETLEQLKPIWNQYQTMAAAKINANLVASPEFVRVKTLLSEFVSDPLERQRRGLARAAKRLESDLARFRTGKDWQKFLSLPQAVFEANPTAMDRRSEYAKELTAMASRFEKTQANPAYRTVTELSSFQETRRLLTDYAKRISLQAGKVPESLPRPKRDKKQID